ncbi:MAG: diguanylate cyclase, partial [Candidatus Thiodiazotropha sp.]
MQLRNRIILVIAAVFLGHFLLQGYLDYRRIRTDAAQLAELQRGVSGGAMQAAGTESAFRHALERSLLTHGIGFLLAFLLLGWLLDRLLLTPILRLKRVAKELAQGNYGVATELGECRHLTHLSHSLERMAGVIAQREQALNRQKGLYAVLSQTNKSIIRNESPQRLYERFCYIAVAYGGFSAAWVGAVDRPAGLIRRLAAACPDGRVSGNPSIRLDTDDPLGMAVIGGCPVIIDQIDWAGGDNAWMLLDRRSVGQSAAVLPVMRGDQVPALLAVFAEEPDYFDDTIKDLLEEVAGDLAFAIENHERNQAHRAAHRELEASSERLARLNRQMHLLLESTGEGIFGVDRQGYCSFINAAAATLLGYQREQLLNQPIHTLIRLPEYANRRFNHGMEQQKAPKRVKDESFRRQDGTLFPVEYSTYPILQDGEVQGSVSVFRDVTETRSMMREMRFLAGHDPLTHLSNRHAFDQRLRQAFADVRDYGVGHVLCYMDLDQFKVVNDTCGHVAGDTMLRHLSHHLRQAVGADGVLARLGGDEFGLLLERCELEAGLRVVDRIFEAVKRFRFSWEGRTFSCGVSIGVVVIDPETESTHSALSAADTACYVAKDMGRNRVHVYRPYDEEITRQQGEMRWVNRIESAIQLERFRLLQQPIMSLASSAIGDEHVEVLLRMLDDQGGEISPGA